MEDRDVYERIRELVAEEHDLRDDPAAPSPDRVAALRRVEEALDQCWDLLRQRRARREYGDDPADAQARPVTEVEGYVQ